MAGSNAPSYSSSIRVRYCDPAVLHYVPQLTIISRFPFFFSRSSLSIGTPWLYNIRLILPTNERVTDSTYSAGTKLWEAVRRTEWTQNTSNSFAVQAFSWKSLPSAAIRTILDLLPRCGAPQNNTNYTEELPTTITNISSTVILKLSSLPCIHALSFTNYNQKYSTSFEEGDICTVHIWEHFRRPQFISGNLAAGVKIV